MGDGWIHNRLDRLRLYVYDPRFAGVIRQSIECIKNEFGLTGSESGVTDRLTGTYEWRFEIGGSLAVKNLDLGLLARSDGAFSLAGLWDADGNWSAPDPSHPLGQARLFGNYHTIRYAKRGLRHSLGIRTGKMSVTTPVGHVGIIGDYKIITRADVYGTGVLARSMPTWVGLVGSRMLLKGRPEVTEKAFSSRQEKSFTPLS